MIRSFSRGLRRTLALLASSVPLAAQTVQLPARSVTISTESGTARFHGAGISGRTGSPGLPRYTVTLLLPAGTDPKTITAQIVSPREEIVAGTWDVAPVPPLSTTGLQVWPQGARISQGRDLDAYARDAFAPSSHIAGIRPAKLGNYQLVEVDIDEYQYNPVRRQLRHLVGGTLEVKSSAPTTLLSGSAYPSAAQRRLQGNLRSLASNYDQAIGSYPVGRTLAGATGVATPRTTYTILSTEAIRTGSSQLGLFADTKVAAGWDVELITANSAYKRTAGSWSCAQTGCGGGFGPGKGDVASEAMRAWLKANWESHDIEYVLLVGNPDPDTGSVPMKHLWPRLGATEYPEAPSDYYYSELTGNWDLNGDGMYGQETADEGPGGMERICEVAVGRIPFYGNMVDLDRILAKTIRYLTEKDISWRSNVLFSMRQMFYPSNNYYLGEYLKTNLLDPRGWGTYRVYDSAWDVAPEKIPTTEANVLDAWKSRPFGYHLWITHGWSQGGSDVFSSPSAPLLDDLHPSFTFQASCLTAYPEDPDNLAYALLKNGGIATVGATRVSWLWAEEREFESQEGSYGTLGNKFSRYLIADTLPVGKALVKLRANTLGWWMNMQDFNVYGDPSLVLGNAGPAAPGRVENLTASALDRRVQLRWNAASGATGYEVLRGVADLPLTALAQTVASTSLLDEGLENGSRYRYAVVARNATGAGPSSDTVAVVPVAPASGLRLQYRIGDASSTDNQIKPFFAVVNTGTRTESLAGIRIRYWFSNDNTSGLQTTCDWAQIGASNLTLASGPSASTAPGADRILEVTFGAGAPALAPGASTGDIQIRINHLDWTSFTERGDWSYDSTARNWLAPDKICLYGSAGELVSGHEPTVVDLPQAPTRLLARAGDKRIDLSWSASRGATSYDILRRIGTGGLEAWATAIDTTWADLAVTNGNTYTYAVRGRNASGVSVNSPEATALPAGVPLAPTLLAAIAGDRTITANWLEVGDATGYTLKATAKAGDTIRLSLATGVQSADLTGLVNGTAYQVMVSASNAHGEGANSQSMSATPVAIVPPAAVEGVVATATNAKVALSWKASAGATYYLVERADTLHPFAEVARGTILAYNDLTVTNGTTYSYRVRGANASGPGAYSATQRATPQASTVTEPCSPATDMTGGQSGNFNTTAGVCKRTSANIAGWGCSNFTGRTVKVNGVAVACGGALPPKTSSGHYYFEVSPGAYSWASLYWW